VEGGRETENAGADDGYIRAPGHGRESRLARCSTTRTDGGGWASG
jgi:hypothetical protein